jgi:hypothetical protein
MSWKFRIYMALTVGILAADIFATWFMIKSLSGEMSLALAAHRAAFLFFLLSAACIEARVRMGYRLPHKRLFWIHLSAAIPFFLLLGALSFAPLTFPAWLGYLDFILFIVTLPTGVVLFTRGVSERFREDYSA